jgi:hypothetical protein
MLHRMQLALRSTAFDRGDFRTVEFGEQDHAPVDPAPVGQHRAGFALAPVAAFLGSGEIVMVTREIEQRQRRVVLDAHLIALHGQPRPDIPDRWHFRTTSTPLFGRIGPASEFSHGQCPKHVTSLTSIRYGDTWRVSPECES